MIFFPSRFKWSSVSQQLHILGGESLNSSPDVGLWLRGPTCNSACKVLTRGGRLSCAGQPWGGWVLQVRSAWSVLTAGEISTAPQSPTDWAESEWASAVILQYSTLGHTGTHRAVIHAKLDRKNTKQRSRAYDWGHTPAEPAVRLFVSKYSRSFEKSV